MARMRARSRIFVLVLCLYALGCGPELQRQAAVQPAVTVSPGHEAACDQREITLAGLIAEMVDLSCLTRLPRVAFTSYTETSYDRASRAAAKTEASWFANADVVALQPGQPRTLLDVRGPGVITRFWTAKPEGRLRIYLDDEAKPAIDAELKQLLRGEIAPFGSPFSFVAARGHNLYFPISFARACRVTLTGDAERFYFQIGYRRYAPDARIERFGPAALDAARATLADVSRRLLQRDPTLQATPRGEPHSYRLDTADPERRTIALVASPGGSVIRQLRIWPASFDPALLRSTALRLRFDGHPTVHVPLGDLFAAGMAVRNVNAWPIGVLERGPLTSRWPMAFEREAHIELESTGADELSARIEVGVDPLPWTERSLLFHARWRAPETFPSKPERDWPLAQIEGRGHYVGTILNVVNPNESWWGEGDEKIYRDGEPFPSHFGTGTEDYFGYAWCANEVFSTAYVGQPLATERRNFGASSLYRFHILDPIPFQRSLQFDLEVRHWGPAVDVTYDATSVWYARPGDRPVASPPSTSFRLPVMRAKVPDDVPMGPYDCGG